MNAKRTTQLVTGNWPAILVLSLVLTYLFAGHNKGLTPCDEGLAVYGADRVLHGDMPYRDFLVLYGPASFYAMAWLFKAFGISLVVEKAWLLIIACAQIILGYLTATRLTATRLTLIVPILIAITWNVPCVGPEGPIMVFTLLSLLSVLKYFSVWRVLWLIVSGVCIGVVTLLRPDQGVMVCTAALLSLSFGNRLFRAHMPKITACQAGAYLLSAVTVVALPVALWILHSVPMANLTQSFIVYPFKVYPHVRRLPFPTPIVSPLCLRHGMLLADYYSATMDRMQYHFPIIVLAAAGLSVFRIYRDRTSASVQTFGLVSGTAYLLCLLAQVSTRSDYVHVRGSVILASILLPAVASSVHGSKAFKAGVAMALILTFLPFVSMGLCSVRNMRYLDQYGFEFSIERARGICADPSFSDYQDLILYVQDNVPENEKIFVGNLRHDRIYTNESMVYFLANRQSCTYYNELDPGSATTEPVQRQIIHDIQRNNVHAIVLRAEGRSTEPNDSGKSSGVHLLDDFIRANFFAAQTFGAYSVWFRTGDAWERGSP